MESTSETIIKTFNAFGDLNEAFIALAALLRKKEIAGRVHTAFEMRRLHSGCLVEVYVECEPDENESFCWWLETTVMPAGWKIESEILKDQSTGQEILQRFPDRTGKVFDQLLAELKRAGEELIASAHAFEFHKK